MLSFAFEAEITDLQFVEANLFDGNTCPACPKVFTIFFNRFLFLTTYRFLTVYLLLRVNLDKIMHARGDLDAANA